MAINAKSGQPPASEDAFTATGAGTPFRLSGSGNARLQGTFVGTFRLERSTDNGSNYYVVSRNETGDDAEYTGPVDLEIHEAEQSILWRWYCSAYTSGTANTRIGGA